VHIEEIEDEDLLAVRNKPTSPKHLLIHVDKLDEVEDYNNQNMLGKDNSHTQEDLRREAHQSMQHAESENIPLFNDLPPPPRDAKPIWLHKK